MIYPLPFFFFFFFNDTATTEIYTLSLHDALPINPRDVELRLTRAGEGSDHGWSLQVRTDQLLHSPPRRLTPSGTSLPGLGRNYGDLWIGVFNPEPAAPAVYELTVTITVQRPPGIRRAFSPLGRGPR